MVWLMQTEIHKGQKVWSCVQGSISYQNYFTQRRSLECSISPAFTALVTFLIGWFQSSSLSLPTSSSSSFLLPFSPHVHAHYWGMLSHLWAGVSPGLTPVLYAEFGISQFLLLFLISDSKILENTGSLGLYIVFSSDFFFLNFLWPTKYYFLWEIDSDQLLVGVNKVEAQGF